MKLHLLTAVTNTHTIWNRTTFCRGCSETGKQRTIDSTMTLGSFLAQTVGPALLPPADAIDFEYYDILKLNKSRSTSVADVRKAYKLLSLQLHPDKIAQKGGNREEAALLYERVQEAADVLSDDTKRRIYKSYNYSVARYRFVSDQHGWMNPTLLQENLKDANCVDRTRLWCATTFLLVLILLQPILIAIKVNSIGNADNILSGVSWWFILVPFWTVYGIYIFLRCILVAFAIRDRFRYGSPKALPTAALASIFGIDPSESTNDCVSNYQISVLLLVWCESIALLVGIVLLVLQWDRPLNAKKDWIYNSIPFYCIVLCLVVRHVLNLQQVRYVQSVMISTNFVRMQNGVDWDDATDEQRAVILQSNVVVQPDPVTVAKAISVYRETTAMEQMENDIPVELSALDEKDIESIRVQCSDEYHLTELAKKQYHSSLGNVVLIYVTFIALVTAKLQQQIEDTSWWIVFLPFWISYGLPFLNYSVVCCCGGSVSDLDLLDDENDKQDDDGNETDDDKLHTDVKTKEKNNINDAGDIAAAKIHILGNQDGVIGNHTDSLEENHKNAAELRSSVQWASPDGLMDEFNSPSKQQSENDDKKNADSLQPHVDNIDDSKPEGMDEETFRRFQQHLQENEREYMEQKVNAFIGCCNICFQMAMLCLLVAKLENDYNAYVLDMNNIQNGDTDGFNAVWVLFPVLLISGFVLIFCTCCICTQVKGEELPDLNMTDQSPNADTANATNPIIIQSNDPCVNETGPNPVVPSVDHEIPNAVDVNVTNAANTDTSLAAITAETLLGNNKVESDIEAGGAINDLD
jgi:DnaJ domain